MNKPSQYQHEADLTMMRHVSSLEKERDGLQAKVIALKEALKLIADEQYEGPGVAARFARAVLAKAV